ncbi:MATE family efflux transporter [Embleya sp. NBC_00896]|uniref:MATE family efflux transporter n=1 Tax=Embleya sp. NBC_00896 TaxID=2975961 RepID=UPI0038631559|nr:MATE family efflux transporter [Embleya sp. NBC_00896]
MTGPDTTTRDHVARLGTRPVGRLLWSNTAQATVAVATYGIYALTNALFVSRGVGATAFAAVNIVAPVLLVLGAVSTTVGTGGASLVSRSLGAGDTRQAARATGNTFVVYWTAALLIGGLGAVALDPLLSVLGATGETHEYAHDYGLIILAGSITATGFSSLVRAEGRLRYATMLWVVPILVQITLDPVLIFGFGLGVRGAALGTVGGQAVSLGMSLWFFFGRRDRPYRITAADLRPHGPTLRQLVSVGAPSFLGRFGATLVVALANNLLMDSGGATALSAYAICVRIGTLVLMPQLGISQGMQPLIGYNAGRGLDKRVDRTRTLALRASVVYGTAACLLLLLFAGPPAGVFTDDPEVRGQAVQALRILALSYPLAGVATLVSAYFQALGRARPSYVISIGSLIAVQVPLLLAFSAFGSLWLWISFPVAEAVAAGAALGILRHLS